MPKKLLFKFFLHSTDPYGLLWGLKCSDFLRFLWFQNNDTNGEVCWWWWCCSGGDGVGGAAAPASSLKAVLSMWRTCMLLLTMMRVSTFTQLIQSSSRSTHEYWVVATCQVRFSVSFTSGCRAPTNYTIASFASPVTQGSSHLAGRSRKVSNFLMFYNFWSKYFAYRKVWPLIGITK